VKYTLSEEQTGLVLVNKAEGIGRTTTLSVSVLLQPSGVSAVKVTIKLPVWV
jgi:Tfp pilus assembly pilus retraction ATPase PilT